jgi:hypothetical protein
MTRIVELIYTEDRRGTGEKDDLIRMCPQLWTKDGRFVVEHDPWGGGENGAGRYRVNADALQDLGKPQC